MRSKILFLLIALLPLCASAQENSTNVETVDRVSLLKPFHRGEYVASITASFGNFSNNNSSMLMMLENLDTSGQISSVKPSFGYFYNDSSMVGARLSYTNIEGEIASASLDLGNLNDLSLDVPFISVMSRSYAAGLFHRSYTKLDRKGQFELFSEIEALVSYGDLDVAQEITGANGFVQSKSYSLNVGFSPGLAVNLTPNVATFVSFGLGGFSFSKVMQYDADGGYIGKRNASQFGFKIDLFDINFGLAFHFWNNKKQ